MAADSDGPGGACGPGGGACGVVVTCEGDLRDPRFPARLRRLLRELRALLAEPHPNTLKVNKVEPWNSVRVTLSVPRAAAARLRALAAAGAPQLRALGILSVQLDGDAAVSLRLQHGAELRINTDADDASTSRSQPSTELLAGLGGIGRLLADTDGASTSAAPPAPGTPTPATPTPATPQTPTPSPQQPSRDNFKSPNTVCPMDGKIPQNIPTPTTADRCEYPFGSMTQARVIHRKENTLGLGACAGGLRSQTAPGAEPQFARPSTSTFAGPPPPYPAPAPPATPPLAPAAPPAASAPPAAPPTVAMSSPLLVNLLQNDAAAPQPRAKQQQHPAKLDRLEDSQVELAVGRAPFEYRGGRPVAPRPPPSASPAPPATPPAPPRAPRPPPFVRRAFPAARPAPPATPPAYRSPAQQAAPAPNATVVARPRYQPGYGADSFPAPPPPPYRQQVARPRPPLPRVTPEDFQALLPPSTTMDQKTQSSFQEFQRYQQQYNARQRAASRDASQQQDWNEPYRDSLSLLPDLPDTCDLDQLLPTLGADLNLDDTALSAISDLDTNSKLDLLSNYEQQDGTTNSTESNPDALLREITGQYSGQLNGPYTESTLTANRDVPSKSDTYEAVNESTFMPPPPVPQQSTSKTFAQTANHTIMNTHHPPFKSPPPNVSYMTASSMNSDRAIIHRLGATSSDRMAASSINTDRGPGNSERMTPTSMSSERMGQTSMNSDSMSLTGMNSDRMGSTGTGSDRISTSMSSDRMSASSMNSDRLIASSMNSDRIGSMSMNSERMATTSVNTDRMGSMSMNSDRMAATSLNSDRIGGTRVNSDTMGATSINSERLVGNTSSDRMVATSMNSDRMGLNNMSNERMVASRLNDRTVASITSTDRMVSTSMNTERIVSSSMNSERSIASTLNHSMVANRMAGQSSSMPSSMPPPMRLPVRATTSVSTATVGSQATAQEIEEQSKQYLIKTLMRDDDIPPPKEPEKKPEELTVAQCKVKENSTDAPEMFGIAKITEIDDSKRSDDDKKNKLLKKDRDEKLVAQKGGKPRTSGTKEKPTSLKDRIVRDGKSTKVALPRPHAAKPAAPNTEAPKSPSGEKESIKLRLKLDKNEPVVQPVYKADVSFINLPKGDKSSEGELRVPPLHISLRGRNSAVIKNSKKEKKKFGPGDLHTKKIKIRKTLETDDKSHRRESDETLAPKSGDGTENSKTDEYLHVKNIKLNNHYEGDAIKTEIAGDNSVVYRMKTISKNAHIVTKSHEFKLLNNKVQTMDSLKLKKKSKLLSESGKAIEKERDKEWRNDLLEKEGKYAQNEGYREMVNNHEMKKKLPTPKLEKDGGGAKCDNLKSSDVKTVVQVDTDYNEVKTGASEDSRLLKCHKSLERTMSVDDTDTTKFDSEDNKLKRTLTESAITSPNGLIALEKKRKVSHSSCPDPPGSTNVGTIGANRVDSPPPASSQRCGAQSPRRRDRPKDKSYCKLVAERARPDPDKFGNRSPNSQAQGEDSGIESMDALSEKSPNQASQSPPGPQRKERLDMPRSTSPTSVQRIIGVIEQPPPSDELLERLSLAAGQPHYDPVPPDIDDMGDIEAELAKMHADHVNGDDAPRRPPPPSPEPPREPTPILRDDDPAKPDLPPDDRLERPAAHGATSGAASPKKERVDEFDLPSRMSPPLYTYSNQEKACSEAKDEKSTVAENGEAKSESEVKNEPEPKLERLPLKADFPDKSLLEQLLIEIPTPDYAGKRPESPSPSALERVARSSVRTRSSSKMSSPADGPKTPRLSPGVKLERSDSPLQPRNCLRSGSVDKTSPRTGTAAGAPAKPGPGAKRKRRESESSCASTVSCEEGPSPGRPKKKPRKVEPAKPSAAAAPAPAGGKAKKDSDSDSDEPLICKVRGKGAKGPRAPVPPVPPGAAPVGAAGVGTRRSVRHGPAPPAPPADTPVRRKTRSAVGEGGTPATPGTVRRRRASRDGK